jgi:cytochrome c biogenesis protein CcmG/thiol:disulfide interchange protein DsbE
MELKAQNAVPIFGIDWREKNRTDGPAWLARYGNPYTRIGDDPKSVGAIAFGVTGAPESFIVDKKGIVRYKHTGVITKRDWERTLLPIIQELRRQ